MHTECRLRVLQLIDSLVQGGAEQLIVTQARYINRERYDLRVCSLTAPEDHSPVVIGLRELGIPIISLEGRRRHDPWHIPRLIKVLGAQHIDIVHTHLSYANIVGAAAGSAARRPVVCTLHSVQDWHRSFSRLKRELQAQSLRWGMTRVIACSTAVEASARARLHVPARKLTVVANGIDTRAFESVDAAAAAVLRTQLLAGRQGPLVVTVGNILPAKGHQYLIEAAALLVERFPQLRVVIVGREGDSTRAVREHIEKLGMCEHVQLAGQRSDIPLILAAADCFAFPSVYEGLPLALLEAMASAAPVVSSAVGEIPKVVEDGVTGRLVPPGDSVALAGALGEMLADPIKAGRLGAAARVHVQATYGAAAWVKRIESIYDQVARRLHADVRRTSGSRRGDQRGAES